MRSVQGEIYLKVVFKQGYFFRSISKVIFAFWIVESASQGQVNNHNMILQMSD
jgi:hypothetical protein